MRLIPNEPAYAEKCLKYNKIDKGKPYKSVRVVILYFYLVHEMTKEEILDNTWSYVRNCNVEHKISYDYLKDEYIEKVIKTTKELKQIDNIVITQNEIKSIMNNNYPHSYRKVLFTMLVMFKTKYKVNNVFNCKIDSTEVDILKDAHVTMTRCKRDDMWRAFQDDGYVTLGEFKKGGETYLHYVDENEENVAIEVTDFDDYYMFFEQYKKGGKLKYCEVCGKLILVQGKARTKYCKECARKVNIEKTNTK